MRLLRLLRLGRFVRGGIMFQSIQEQLRTTVGNIQYSILRIVAQLLLSSHVIACLWFLVGKAHSRDSTWLEDSQLKEKSVSLQYATSLPWGDISTWRGQHRNQSHQSE